MNTKVLTNLVGAIAECCRAPNNRIALRMAGGLPPLVALLSGTNTKLLENTVLALGQVANEPQSLKILLDLDGVRLIWTLLKCSDPKVQANAAASLCPFIKYSEVEYIDLIYSICSTKIKKIYFFFKFNGLFLGFS